MSVAIMGLTITPILQRNRTTTIEDGGAVRQALRISGFCSRSGVTTAKENDRQLHELAWYSRHAGGVYVNSDEADIDDGLYLISDVETGHDPAASRTGLFTVSLTLTRLGGGPFGSNLLRRVVGQADLQVNSWSITSTPLLALPVGATGIDTTEAITRAGYDSATAMSIRPASSAAYVLSGADYQKGEVRIWDTGGSADSTTWKRVYSPDHTFASAAHLVLDNTLIRFQSLGAGTNKASHTVEVYTSSPVWTMVTDSTRGDGINVGAGGLVTDAYAGVVIRELGPWRAVVEYQMFRTTAPYYWTKTITLERGKYLGLVELETTGSAAYMEMGMTGSSNRFVITVPAATAQDNTSIRDHTTQTGSVDLDNTGSNLIATWTGPSATAMGLGATRTTTPKLAKNANGGFAIYNSSTTSLAAYLGGVPYAGTSSAGEAELQTLDGTATAVNTLAGASGSGNNQVLMDAVNDGVTWTAFGTYGPTGIRVRFWVRLAVSSNASATDNLIVIIRRTSDATNLATRNIKANEFGANNTWQWFSLEYNGWNGTDNIRPLIGVTVRGAGTNWYADIGVMVTLDQTFYAGPRIVAQHALTEMTPWPVSLPAVR